LKCKPDDVLGWIVKAYQDRNSLTGKSGPIGLIVARLYAGEAPAAFLVEHAGEILPESYLEKIGMLKAKCSYCTDVFETRQAKTEHEEKEHPVLEMEDEEEVMEAVIVQDASAFEAINGSLNAVQAWQSVLAQMSMEMPRVTFDTRLRYTKAVRFDGNTLTISVRDEFSAEWLESRLTSTVERLLIGILNQEVKVVFTVGQMQMEEV